jgi:uncharacterized repeat protein (TIGR01451 family)
MLVNKLFRILVILLLPVNAMAALTTAVTLVTGQPGSILPGEQTQIEITLGNSNTGSTITGLAFNSPLPAGFPDGLEIAGAATYQCTDYVDPPGPATGPTTTPGVGTLTATIGGQLISLTGGVIPARASNTDGSCTIIIPVTAGTSTGNNATYTYDIANNAVTGNDGAAVANVGAVSQSINVLAFNQPVISKGFSASTVTLGGNASTLTFSVTNTNSVAIPNFSMTDAFPQLGGSAIIEVANPANATSNCTSGTPSFTPVVGADTVVATGDIPANGSCTFTVDVIASHTNGGYTTGAQTNRITSGGDFTNDLGIPAAGDATSNITVRSSLSVSKAFNNSVLSSGQSDTFTITLNNDSNSALTITTFDDNPIDGTAGIGGGAGVLGSGLVATGVASTCAGAVGSLLNAGDGIRVTGGVIPANNSCTVTVNFTAAAQVTQVPITYTNTIAEDAVNVTTPNVVSQTRSATVLVADELRVLKTANPSIAAPGNPVNYVITVQNFSNSVINAVTINDVLPVGFTYLTGVIAGNDFNPTLTAACGVLTETSVLGDVAAQFSVATLPARTAIGSPGACDISFWAMLDPLAADGVATANTIDAGQVCYNAGTTCNGSGVSSGTTTAETTVFSATKRFNNTSSTVTLPEGTIATLSVTLTNISANPLTNVTLSDTFPSDGLGQLQVATPANASTTCGGTVTAVAGTTSLALTGGTVPARAANGTGANGTCVINVDVIGPAGTFDNVAQLAGTQTFANGGTGNITQFDTNTARLVYLSSLLANKSFNPTAVSSGGTSRVSIRLSNSGAVALTNVSVTDPLPAGMVLANPVNAASTCAGSPVFTSAVVGASSITMQGASIAGLGSCDVLFDVVATGAGDWINTIPVGNITADGGIINTTAVTDTLLFQPGTGISVGKTSNPSTLSFPGETSQLTITFTNGTNAVTNMAVTDYFTVDGTVGGALNGMVVAVTPNASTTCTGGTVTAVSGGTQVALSNVSLAASQACTVTVDVSSTSIGGITNFIPIGSITSDQGSTNAGQATTSLTVQSNLGVVKEFTPKTILPGERSRLRITFLNPTNVAIGDLSVIDTMPAGVTIPSGANPITTCLGGVVSSPAADQVQVVSANLPAASGGVSTSCYAEIDVTSAAQGDYVNTIPVGAVTGVAGGSTISNSQPTSDTLSVKTPLTIHKAFDNNTLDAGNPVGLTTGTSTVSPGASSTLTIRMDNPNAQALTGVAFIDDLPANLVIAQTPNASTTCAGGFVDALASATSVRLSGATVPASGFCTVSVDVLSNISGNYVNSIAPNAVTSNEGVSNEEGTSAELLVSTPPSVDKQFAPAVISSGGISTLTIVFDNQNATDITLTSSFVDSLPTAPGAIVIAGTPNVVKTCPGAVTAAAGSGSVTYANGAVIPAGGCTISVDVTGTVAGEHVNNIPAGDLQTTVGNNQTPANTSLIISPLGFVSGQVFTDNNLVPNGVFDSGTDTPLSGVSIELRAGATCASPLAVIAGVTNPTTTDGLGNYLFANLPAGTYSVCEPVQPTNTANGTTTAGAISTSNGSSGTAGTATNPTATSSEIENIILNGDGASGEVSGSANNTFAEIAPSSISGVVFLDQNNNGIQNGADTPLVGETIELLDNLGAVITSVVTDANGAYTFTGLAPGIYSIRQPNQPASTSNGQTLAGVVANGGTDGTATNIATLPSQISTIILPPNTSVTANNFAEIPQTRRISGSIFLDYDSDGIENNSDHGIGGQTVNLTGTDINGNPVNLVAVTANDGSYVFDGLPEGTYTVTQPNQPVGTTNGITTVGSTGGTATAIGVTPSAISVIDLTGANTVSGANNFAELPGAAVDLAITKTHSPASFGAGSNTGFYTITPSNIGTLDSSGTITIVDTLPAGMTAFAWPTTGDWICSVAGQIVTCNSSTVITAGGVGSDILLQVAVAAGTEGQILTNNVVISGGNEPPGFDGNNDDSDSVSIAAAAAVEGTVWIDANHDRVLDGSEQLVPGWVVELVLNGNTVASTLTDSNGDYLFTGLSPGSGYQIRFTEPTSGAVLGQPLPNEIGGASTSGVTDPVNNPAGAEHVDGTLNNLTLLAGTTTSNQSLPLDPSGVIYDSVTRNPVVGATVTLVSGGIPVPNVCLVGANNNQVVGALGIYQFLLVNPAPVGCPGDAVYTLEVVQPSGYLPPASTIIPETAGGPYTPVGGIDAIQPQATPPTGGQATTYYFDFNLTLGGSGVINNHIPIDPILEGALLVTKTTPKKNVVRGDLIPYTVTATNTLTATLTNLSLQDQIPAGFKYISGSSSVNGTALEPIVAGRLLSWSGLTFLAGETKTIQLILIVGSGVSEGEYVNQAWANNDIANARVSNVASATVRVVPDPLFDCSDLIGKVFDDENINGYQDKGEKGIAGVRLATVRGLLITTDNYGRFHVACADVPNELHGSNFIMKLDERTLPSGYRVTTENPRVVRLTRGKITKLNFGAGIHRVVRVDINNLNFDKEGETLTVNSISQIDELVDILKEKPSLVRLAYFESKGETKADVEEKMKLFIDELTSKWQSCDCSFYELTVEQEIVPQAFGKTSLNSLVGDKK